MRRQGGKKSLRKKKPSRTRHIAFAVSAGCYPYQMGIASYIQKNFDLEDVFFSGASGGAWAALLLAAEEDLDEALAILISDAPKCCEGRHVLGAYGVYDVGMKLVFNRLFEDRDLAAEVNGRLAISVTRMAWKSFSTACSSLGMPYLKDEVISHFTSNSDIIDCIIASALIPFALNGRPYVRYRDWACCVDAGMTNVPGVVREYDRMSSLIHKPADLKSLHVRVSPRSSRCPSVEWGEEEKEKESGLIEGAVAGEKLVSSQLSGAVTGLGYGSSGQVEQRDNGDRDGVCIGWLGGIESKDEGDGIIFESDGSAEDVLEKAAEERKEEDRRRTRSLDLPSVTVGMKWINRRSEKYQVRDYPGSADALRGGGHVTPAPLSGMVSQMNGGAVPSSSGAKGGVSGGSSVSQLRASAISHWSSIPQSRVTDSGLGDNSNSGVESSFHFLGDGAPPYSIEHGGCGDEVGGIRTAMTQLESDESSSSRDNKAREMGNIIDTDPDPDTNTAEQKEQDTEERTEEGSLVGGNVTAPGGEGGRGVGGEKGGEGDSRGRGRASTVFLSLWDIAAYGTGALGARLDEIERFGLRSTGYLDESDTEDEESDGKSDSQSDTDDSEAGIGIFNSHIFTRAHTSIVSVSEHLKTAAQKAHSRLSLSYAYSIFAGPETSPSPLTPATLCVPEVERPDGTGAETFIDRAKGSRQQTIYEDAVFVFSPDGSQEETLDLGNLTKITAEKNDISAASPNTFISRFLAAKINFFKATPPSDGHDVRTPGLFPIIGADGDADYALNEGSSGRGSALMERSVREGRAPSSSSYLPHLPQQSAASSSF